MCFPCQSGLKYENILWMQTVQCSLHNVPMEMHFIHLLFCFMLRHHCSYAILKYKCHIIILHKSQLESELNNGCLSRHSFIFGVWAPCNQYHINHLKTTHEIYQSWRFHRLKCVKVSKLFVFLFPFMKRLVTSLALPKWRLREWLHEIQGSSSENLTT